MGQDIAGSTPTGMLIAAMQAWGMTETSPVATVCRPHVKHMGLGRVVHRIGSKKATTRETTLKILAS